MCYECPISKTIKLFELNFCAMPQIKEQFYTISLLSSHSIKITITFILDKTSRLILE